MFANLFNRKPSPSEAGRVLRSSGKWEHKLAVRAKVEQMCRDMGKPLPVWPQ